MADPLIAHLADEIERRAAEEFLASAGRELRRGLDLNDSAVRAGLLKPVRSEFFEFQISPLPEGFPQRIKRLPADWRDLPDWYPDVERITYDLEDHFNLRPVFRVSLSDRGDAWVHLIR